MDITPFTNIIRGGFHYWMSFCASTTRGEGATQNLEPKRSLEMSIALEQLQQAWFGNIAATYKVMVPFNCTPLDYCNPLTGRYFTIKSLIVTHQSRSNSNQEEAADRDKILGLHRGHQQLEIIVWMWSRR